MSYMLPLMTIKVQISKLHVPRVNNKQKVFFFKTCLNFPQIFVLVPKFQNWSDLQVSVLIKFA